MLEALTSGASFLLPQHKLLIPELDLFQILLLFLLFGFENLLDLLRLHLLLFDVGLGLSEEVLGEAAVLTLVPV